LVTRSEFLGRVKESENWDYKVVKGGVVSEWYYPSTTNAELGSSPWGNGDVRISKLKEHVISEGILHKCKERS
jgi:hypothetical protein